MKNVNYINEIGEKYSKEYDIPFLFADFKKKNRYLRSVQISKELNMYRQEYCGCVYSLRDTNRWRMSQGRDRIKLGVKFYSNAMDDES